MNKNIIIGIFISAVAASAGTVHADMSISAFETSDRDCGTCAAQPANGFTYTQAEQAFQTAAMPTTNNLLGSWKMVGIVSVSKYFSNDRNAYDPTGIKNSDSSARNVSFSSSSDDFFGGNSLSATLLALGNKNASQGPYSVSFVSSVGAACFAQYAYDNGIKKAKSYFNYECRTVGTTKMLCAMRLVLDPEEMSTTHVAQRVLNGQIGTYIGFVRNVN